MLGIVKRSEEELAAWLATEAGFIGGLCSLDGEPIVLEPYRVAFLENRSRFRWITKSRQLLQVAGACQGDARVCPRWQRPRWCRGWPSACCAWLR